MRQLSQVKNKDLLLDYTIAEEHHPFWKRVQDYQEMSLALAQMRSEFETQAEKRAETPSAKLSAKEVKNRDQHWQSYQALKVERDGLAKTIARNWGQHALYVQQCHIPRETLEIQAGLRPIRLSEAEKRACSHVEDYAAATLKAREIWNEIKLTHSGSASRLHVRYAEFEEVRIERDSLASLLAENARLHRPFTKNNGVNWQSIKSQAQTHLQRGLKQSFYARLSPEERELYDRVKAYRQARNHCSQVWHELKRQDSPELAQDRVLKPWENKGYEAWKQWRNERDHQAAIIIKDLTGHRQAVEQFNINEDSLYQEGHSHEVRSLVQSFKTAKEVMRKGKFGIEIERWREVEREGGKKYVFICLMEEGLKPWDIGRAIERHEIEVYKSALSAEQRAEFERIESYKEASDYCKTLWGDYMRAAKALESAQPSKPETSNLAIMQPSILPHESNLSPKQASHS